MLTLTRYQDDPLINVPTRHVWPLRLVAVSDDEAVISSAVFVYHIDADGYSDDLFECVASVQQMDDLPDSPAGGVVIVDGRTVPYYRAADATFNCRSIDHREEVWDLIRDDVEALVKNTKLTQNLGPTEVVHF